MDLATSWVSYIIPFTMMAGILLFPLFSWLSSKEYKDNEE